MATPRHLLSKLSLSRLRHSVREARTVVLGRLRHASGVGVPTLRWVEEPYPDGQARGTACATAKVRIVGFPGPRAPRED